MRVALLTVVLVLSAQAQLGDILKKADETLNQHDTAGLSNDKIIAGLKEALQVSTGKAVACPHRRRYTAHGAENSRCAILPSCLPADCPLQTGH